MKKLNLQQRKQVLTISSASLILAAFTAGQFGAQNIENLLMIGAAIVAGSDIAVRAWKNLMNKYISIELLVTIAATGALFIGEYWESAAVTFLFIFGAYLEARTLSRTRNVLKGLLDLTPTTAIVIRDGRQQEVMPREVLPYETVIIKPGTKIPVDGKVIDGRSSVDESSITGEPMPEEKSLDSLVFAGTVNQDGLIRVRATGIGADTTLARIIRRVEEAQEEKAPTQRFIEKFAKWYTPFIIGLSVVVFLITWDIELSLTLLVIGCPGALVISTPVSIVAGIGRAAKSGILIKGGEHLENAGKISAIAMDKTGTLTYGKPRLTDIVVLEHALIPAGDFVSIDEDTNTPWTKEQLELLRWAAIAEAGSEHPLARSIMDQIQYLGDIPYAREFNNYPGKGITALFGNRLISIGNFELMRELDVLVPDETGFHLDQLKSSGKTAVIVSVDKFAMGILGIADTIRESSSSMINKLKSMDLKEIVMLTGDDEKTARVVGRETGITNIRAELLPEDKLAAIHELKSRKLVVAMVGDGINDAPALAAADIGIAMGAAGTDIAIETADIALMSDDLMKIPEAIRISKATLKNIRQNVFVALATVSALLAGVLLGEVHMAGGMLIHEASVMIVIFNGMRLLRIK
ncbi:MAG: heavy metal translocating P-type ATPase [Calditrichaceae bacterium]